MVVPWLGVIDWNLWAAREREVEKEVYGGASRSNQWVDSNSRLIKRSPCWGWRSRSRRFDNSHLVIIIIITINAAELKCYKSQVVVFRGLQLHLQLTCAHSSLMSFRWWNGENIITTTSRSTGLPVYKLIRSRKRVHFFTPVSGLRCWFVFRRKLAFIVFLDVYLISISICSAG